MPRIFCFFELTSPFRFHKTRLAPTPSGYLHLGNIFSFALTAALAEKTGARVLLRIDDLDHKRANPEYVNDIFSTLNFLEIPWGEGPKDAEDFARNFSQLKRLENYQIALDALQSKGHVFACTCSRSEILRVSRDGIYPGTCRDKNLPPDTPNACWRLRTDMQKEIIVHCCDGSKIKSKLPAVMQNFVVRKKDGFPAYQLASLVDDLFFGIDLIVRGEDLWDSTLAQLYLASLLGYEDFMNVSFYHHRLLTDDGKKMSKSAGAVSVHYLRDQGHNAADIYKIICDRVGLKEHFTSWANLGRSVLRNL